MVNDLKPKLNDETKKDATHGGLFGLFPEPPPDEDNSRLSNQYGLLLLDKPSFSRRILYHLLRLNIFQLSLCVIFFILYPPPCRTEACSNLIWWQYLYGFIIIITLIIHALWLVNFNFNFKAAYKIVLATKLYVIKFLACLVGLLYPFFALILLDHTSFPGKSISGSLHPVIILLLVSDLLSYLAISFIHNTIRLVFRGFR